MFAFFSQSGCIGSIIISVLGTILLTFVLRGCHGHGLALLPVTDDSIDRTKAELGSVSHKLVSKRQSVGTDVLARFARRFNHAHTKQFQETMTKPKQTHFKSFLRSSIAILKQTAQEWMDDKAPQLGAALAYYTVFSLAPLVLVLLAVIGFLFLDDPAGAWSRVTEQMSYFLDRGAVQVVQDIAKKTSADPAKVCDRDVDRRRSRPFWGERRFRAVAGCS